MFKWICLLALTLAVMGCSSPGTAKNSRMFVMGERAQVGSLIYTVLDTEWLDQIGGPPNPRMPHARFLVVRLSVTNSGAVTSGVPPAEVRGPDGQSFSEVNDISGVPEWLGYVRSVKPAETLLGRIVFDVPAAVYQLKLANDAEPGNEKTATVELPLQFGPPHVPTAPAATQ